MSEGAEYYDEQGKAFLKKGDYSKALECFFELKAIKEKTVSTEHPDTATAYNNIGTTYCYQGDYPKALEWHQKALSIFEKVLGKEHPDTATTYGNIAVVYERQGDYPKALEWHQKALAINEKVLGKEHPNTARTYNNIAVVYNDQGDYPKALEWHQKALSIFEKVLGKEHPDTAVIYNDTAITYNDQGDYPKALEWHQKALAIREKVLGKDHPHTAVTYNNIAIVYDRQGDYPKALEWHQKDLEISEKVLGTEHPFTATAYNNIGVVYKDQGDYPKALEWHQKALAVREKVLGKEHPDTATTYHGTAVVYQRQGDYSKALEWHQKALGIREKVLGKEHPETFATYNGIAVVYQCQGDYPKALEWYQKAKGLDKQHPYYVASLVNLYALNLIMGEYTQALAFQKEAAQQRTNMVNRIFAFLSEQEREKYWNTHSFVFEASYSLSWFHPVMGSNILNYNNALFTKGLLLRTTNAVRDSIYSSDDQKLIDQYKEFKCLRQQIGNLQQKGDGDPVHIKKLEDDAEELDKFLTQASSVFKDFKESLSVSWQDVRRNLLQGEVAVEFVSFRLFNGKGFTTTYSSGNVDGSQFRLYDGKRIATNLYAALVLRPRFDAPEWVPLFDCEQAVLEFLNELNELRKKYPKDEEQPQIYEQMYNEKGHGLYAAVWQPLESILKDAKTVYYSPSGLLHKISFNTIPTKDGAPLMDTYNLNLVSSTREIVSRKNKTTNKPDDGVVYGGLVYDADEDDMKREAEPYSTPDNETRKDIGLPGGAQRRGYKEYWEFLPGMAREGKEVKEILSKNNIPADLYKDTKGNKESFVNLSGQKKSVLHLATHGFFLGDIEKNDEGREKLEHLVGGKKVFENPLLRSGLVLAGANHAWMGEPVAGVGNGILFADDVARMNLVGAQLVVLSACDTALGEVNNSEGVFGLQRAFKLAGAETLIMSLWEVDDKSTCEFMTSFYEKWLSEKKSKQDAFKEAQRQLREKYPSPYYWAAFVMID